CGWFRGGCGWSASTAATRWCCGTWIGRGCMWRRWRRWRRRNWGREMHWRRWRINNWCGVCGGFSGRRIERCVFHERRWRAARRGAAVRARDRVRLGRATNGLTRDDVIGGMGDIDVTFDRIAPLRLRMGQQVDRPWGPEQATGAPNVPTAADDGRAWASLSPD